MSEPAICNWYENSDGNWDTACGELFCFLDGGPVENGMRFCPYCGNKLQAVPYVDDWEDE